MPSTQTARKFRTSYTTMPDSTLIALLAIRGRHQRLDQLPLGIGQNGDARHHTTIGEPTPQLWETRPSYFDLKKPDSG